MHKSLLIFGIMFIMLFCTACVNRFAVQELNNNAKELLAAGKIDAAIARLESSIDLDESVYETHYNLAVAYIQAKEYDKALKSLEKVKELNPEFADLYHSIAVVNEELAYKIISGEDKKKEVSDKDNEEEQEEVKLSDDDKVKICEYLSNAVDNYNKYLTKKANAEDKDKVNEKIDSLNEQIKKYSKLEEKAE